MKLNNLNYITKFTEQVIYVSFTQFLFSLRTDYSCISIWPMKLLPQKRVCCHILTASTLNWP